MTDFKHGQRVVMACDLDELKVGMQGTVYEDDYRIGVHFDFNKDLCVSISRIHPVTLENIKVIDCVKPL